MFPTGMGPPPAMSLYANQFYPAQEPYARADMTAAQVVAARLQSQFPGPYGQGIGMEGVGPPTGANGQGNGPSAHNRKLGLYKTELCRSWEEKGSCRYATKCQFAHGEEELRNVARHPKVCFFTSLGFQFTHIEELRSTRPRFVGYVIPFSLLV
jgi:hypothetical protein